MYTKRAVGGNEEGSGHLRHYVTRVRDIVMAGLRGHQVQVYLFGSAATGQAGPGSDIDVAVLPLESLPPGLLSAIREQLEESTVPYNIDLVDLSRTDPHLRERVQKEGVLWSG